MESYKEQVSGLASCQYNDLKGTAAADNSDSNSGGLMGLRKLIGGTAGGWPIAMNWFLHSRRGQPFVHVSLYMLPSSSGVTSFDEARAYVLERGGDVEVDRYTTTSMRPHEFLGLFKRFDVLLAAKGVEIERLNVLNEIDSDSVE